jgi:hypothetical protein
MTLSRKLRRLPSLSWIEIGVRLRQELAKMADSVGLAQPRAGSLPRDESGQTGRFFFSRDEIPERIELIRAYVPEFEKNTLEKAEQVLEHRFELLGYGPLAYGEEVDWHLDIVSGKRAPLRSWPRIRYLDFDEVGDSKVTWELSRHQFLVTLAKAWLLTGEERFLRKLEHLYYDWHRKNPYPLGVNWASSLEVAFRSLSWIWTRELLAGSETARKLRRDIAHALAVNAWYVRRYLSTYFSPNTHLQGEAAALFFIGTLLPSLPHASHWRDVGRSILLEHARTKVLEDGAYFERSTYYHVYALDFFLHARVLAGCNGSPFGNAYDDALKRMLQHLSTLCQAGPPPRFGDDDGGRVFDGSRNRAEHLPDPLAVGAALFQLDACKQPGVQITEEVLWLLGEEGLRAFAGCAHRKRATSAASVHAGLYISHAGESQVVLDAGQLGGGTGGHAHADELSLTLNLDRKPLLIDPGACVYAGAGAEREYFRTTGAHNTVTVDGLSQAEPRTAFSWLQWPEVQVEATAFCSEFDFIAASHDGYANLRAAVTHRRTLFAPREGYWFVLDELESRGAHEYTLHWHLAPGSTVHEGADRCVVELDGSRLELLTASDRWFRAVESGWYSAAYGQKEAAPLIRFTKRSYGAETFATVLWVGAPERPAPTLTALANSLGLPAYCLTAGQTRSLFSVGDGVSIMEIDGWQSDARFLYAVLNPHGGPLRLVSVQSRFVRYRGRAFQESAQTAPFFVKV